MNPRQPCIVPMAPEKGSETPEKDGGGQWRGRFSSEVQRKQQKELPDKRGARTGGEDALSCHLCAPTWPWAT